MAVIIKNSDGEIRFKSISLRLSREEEILAYELDEILQHRIPEIEKELVKEGLLPKTILNKNTSTARGDTKLWWTLGRLLKQIVENERLVKLSERRFLWEAIRIYSTTRIIRKDRGPSRSHLDYCYRLGRLPWKFVKQLKWSDWVFFIDSKSLLMESRIDEWLKRRIDLLGLLNRDQFRSLAKELNHEFKNIDTSVYSDEELFAEYDEALNRITDSKIVSHN